MMTSSSFFNYPPMMNPMMMLNMIPPVGNCPVFPTTTMSPFFAGAPSPFGPMDIERNRHASIWNIRNWMNWMSKELSCDLIKTPSRPSSWAEYYSMENPIKIDNFGNRTFCVDFDMRTFRPDEIKVGIRNGRIVIEAHHEDKCEETMKVEQIPASCPSLLTKPGVVSRTFYREVTLPDDCRPNNVRAYINPEGMLTINCPLPGLPVCPLTNVTAYPMSMMAASGVPTGLPPMTTALLSSKYPASMIYPPTMPGSLFPMNITRA